MSSNQSPPLRLITLDFYDMSSNQSPPLRLITCNPTKHRSIYILLHPDVNPLTLRNAPPITEKTPIITLITACYLEHMKILTITNTILPLA